MTSLNVRRPPTFAAGLGAGAAAVVAVLALVAGPMQAADPFVAGGRSSREVTVAPTIARQAIDRGRALTRALGVTAVRATSERLDDRFDHRTYDEVTSFDALGEPVAIHRFDPDGRVAMAAALGWHGAGHSVDGPAAIKRAIAAARRSGLAPHGKPEVRASAGAGGWSIAWPRVVGGVPVRGDGLRVLLFADGTFHGLTRTERPLAARPATLLDRAAARAAAERWIAARADVAAGDLRVAAVDQAWVAPNLAADGTALEAPAATLRLAWVVRFDATGSSADHIRTIELWLDAGTGAPLGRDVVE